MARRMLGPAPAAPTHAATKAYVDAEVLNATGGGLTEGGLVSLVHDDGSAIRTALDALYEGGGAWGEITGELADQTDLAAALDGKADAVHAHGLDDITGLPTALDGKADAVHEHHYSEVSGLGTAALADIADFATAAQGARADTAVQPADLADVATSGHYDDLAGAPALAEVATSGSYTDLDDTPALAPVATTGAYADLDGTPVLAAVATSGDYGDLSGVPGIPTALADLDTATTGAQLDAMRTKLDGIETGAQVNVQADWDAVSGPAAIANRPQLAAVALSGDYGDLASTPSIPAALTDLGTSVTGTQLDALKVKVDGIEDGADVTDAARVAAAGAVMASDNDASGFGFVIDEDTMASDLPTRVPTQQSVKAYVDTALGGKADTSHTHSIGDITGLATALDGKQDALGFTPEDSANRGVAGGYATLDNAGKIPVTQLPNSVMEYQGTWDAATNTPTLADGVGNVGDVYRITVGATRDLGSGAIEWGTGQYAIYNGSIWERSGASEGVSSVAGRTGDVVLTKDDVGLDQVDNTSDAAKPVSTAVAAALAGKADTGHAHTIANVSGLQAVLDDKAQLGHTHTIANVTDLQAALDGKAASSHTHAISQVTGLQAALDGKAAASHSHAAADITDLVETVNFAVPYDGGDVDDSPLGWSWHDGSTTANAPTEHTNMLFHASAPDGAAIQLAVAPNGVFYRIHLPGFGWFPWEGSDIDTKADADDPRLSDQRVPTDNSVTNAKVATNAAIALSKLATGRVEGFSGTGQAATNTSIWTGTKAEYDAITTKTPGRVYLYTD